MAAELDHAVETRGAVSRRHKPPTEFPAVMPENSLKATGLALLLAAVIAAPIAGVGGAAILASRNTREQSRLAALERATAYERLVAADAGPLVSVESAAHGRDLFASTCAACHGASGTGAEGLGKNLVESDFVALQSDEALREFLLTGRPAAQPVGMPPKGGNPDLTDEDLSHIVAFVRGLQDPRRMPELPAPVAAAPTEQQKAAALAAAGGDAELAAWIASGDKLFHSSCVACHGKGGMGVPGNGKALVRNTFVQSLDDDTLLAFVKQGRGPTDPKNTTGIQMPPKGGNPALSDDDILDIISYLRTLQEDSPRAASGS